MDNFNFNRDFYEGCKALSEKDAATLAWALIRYGYEEVEPPLKPALKSTFAFARGRIDAMIRGSKGGKKRSRSATKGKASSQVPTQGASQVPTQGASQVPTQGASQQKEKEKEKESKHTDVCLREAATPLGELAGNGDGCEAPSLDAVKAYFAANCLNGDPEAFFDFYASQGWRKSNGMPIVDWHAQAKQWHRKQREIDAEARSRGKPTASEVEAAAFRPVRKLTPEEELKAVDEEAKRYGIDL